MDKLYVVATNDFMSVGGDEYPHFSDTPTINEYKSLEEALESYIRKIGNVNYSIEGRIKVGKNTAPTISAGDVTLNVGDKFDPLKDIKAIDNEDGDITSWIKVIENSVDLNKAGDYKVIYEVKDSQGETTTLEVKVTVNAVKEEEKPGENPKPGEKPGTDKPNPPNVNESGNNKGNLPETGGNNPMLLLLMAVIAVGAGGSLLVNKKNKNIVNK